MKKVLLTVIFFIIVFSPSFVFAQEDIIIPTQSITPTPIALPSPTTIQYDLPYPGLLPGTPLYLLKTIRDKIIETALTKPAKKSNFYLLQADKRLAASLILFEKGQDQLAETTLSKAQNYLEKSLDKAVQTEKEGASATEILGKINTSSKKQSQEIKRLSQIKRGEIRQKLQQDYSRAIELQKRADSINP